MANPRPERLSPTGLVDTPVPRVPPARRRLMMALIAFGIVLLLALAWFDGGEEPLRPIAEPVALPEPGQ